MKLTSLLASVAVTAVMAVPALAETTLRIQTHYGPETISGKNAAQFADDVQVMSNGEIKIEMFYSSSVVASVETFDAAANGILECDMTGGAYQTGKNPAFQFVGDIMGGRQGGSVVATFQMVSDIGAVIGPLLGGLLLDLYGFEWAFAFGAGISALALVFVLLMPETLRSRAKA